MSEFTPQKWSLHTKIDDFLLTRIGPPKKPTTGDQGYRALSRLGWTPADSTRRACGQGDRGRLPQIREDYLYQIRWIFGKLPNGGGSFPIRKIMLRFFGKGKALRAPISRTKAQHFFPKIGWGGVRGRLEVFRKFIEFGPGRSPLVEEAISQFMNKI